MELRQILYFVTIAEQGTITAAARSLHMSQPPLSVQLDQLEQELGCRLFERDTRHLRLTEAGTLFYRRAQQILKLCATAKTEAADARAGLGGTLHIGVVSSLGSSLLPQWAARFHQLYPQVNLDLVESDSYNLLEQLRAQRIDLALVRRPFSQRELAVLPVCGESMCAVGAARFFAVETGPLPLDRLAAAPLLIYRRWERILQATFAARGLAPQFLCRTEDARTAISLAEQGMGVAIVPQSAAPAAGLAVHPLAEPELCSEICAVTLRDHYTPAAAQNFLALLRGAKQKDRGGTAAAPVPEAKG